MLYITDTVTERDPEKLVRCVSMANASFLYKLIQAQWKRGAVGGEKFVNILKTRCGVSEPMEMDQDDDDNNKAEQSSIRTPLEFDSVKETTTVLGSGITLVHTKIHTGTSLNVGCKIFFT